jgi:hypothetical protein
MKMEEMLKAITRAANAIAAHYESKVAVTKAAGAVDAPLVEPRPNAVVVEEPKVRKPRKSKEEPAAAPAAPTFDPMMDMGGEKPAAGGMTEAESLTRVRELATKWIKRFANQQDGIAAFREKVTKDHGVGRFDDLTHAMRVKMIANLEAEFAKADAK